MITSCSRSGEWSIAGSFDASSRHCSRSRRTFVEIGHRALGLLRGVHVREQLPVRFRQLADRAPEESQPYDTALTEAHEGQAARESGLAGLRVPLERRLSRLAAAVRRN